jgi:ATP-dependent RNA helicase DDX3X
MVRAGIDFDRYDDIEVKVDGNGAPWGGKIDTWEEMNLHPKLMDHINRLQWKRPTPIQKYALPIGLSGRDMMGGAQTGSGKTAAFMFPCIQRMLQFDLAGYQSRMRDEFGNWALYPLVLVLSPTRELARQIYDHTTRYCYQTGLRPVVVYGQMDRRAQLQELRRGGQILVATPGRLKDFCDRGDINLSHVKYFVLDEADRMLDMGFSRDITQIQEEFGLPSKDDRQTLMFSATFPRTVVNLAKKFLRDDYLFIRVGRVGSASSSLNLQVIQARGRMDKDQHLPGVVTDFLNKDQGKILIFVASKRSAEDIVVAFFFF